jgi:hypothetical protein
MMKRIVSITFLCSYISVIGLPSGTLSAQQEADARSTQSASAVGASVVFREVEPVLRRESSVPPRLPQFLPFMDESHPIHAVVESATSSGYSILLANALPCEGANWCLYGTVKGSIQPFSSEGKAGKAITVLLRGGIKASFFESECDTYCSQAYVEWRENGYYYSVGIKGPNPMGKTLSKVANSAVAPAVRR